MSLAPDLDGFTDAQRRLRGAFGEEIVFLFPEEVTWPPDTAIDPETGRPYDPVIEPSGSTQPTATVKCNVVFKAINRAGISGEAEATAVGWLEAGNMMLIADITDRATIDGAVRFQARDELWDIHSTLEDGIGGVQRYLVFGRKR